MSQLPRTDADAEQYRPPTEVLDRPNKQRQNDRAHGGKRHHRCQYACPKAYEPVDYGGDEHDEFAEGQPEPEEEHGGVEVPQHLHLAHENEPPTRNKNPENQDRSRSKSVDGGTDERREERAFGPLQRQSGGKYPRTPSGE